MAIVFNAVWSQKSVKTDVVYMIDGHFFNSLKSLSINAQEATATLKLGTTDGTDKGIKVVGIPYHADLPESDVAKAIPAEEFADGEALIDCYALLNSMEGRKVYIAGSENDPTKPGTLFPEFREKDIEGNIWTPDSVKGKVMVLNLWQTACGPCCREMPELSTWKDEMPDVMFFSATYERAKFARTVLEKHGFNWIPLVEDKQFSQWISPNYGYPVTIIIGKDGRIAMTEHGTSPEKRDALKAKIQEFR